MFRMYLVSLHLMYSKETIRESPAAIHKCSIITKGKRRMIRGQPMQHGKAKYQNNNKSRQEVNPIGKGNGERNKIMRHICFLNEVTAIQ